MSTPTTCECEADVTWSEGIPHWTPITDDCPQHGDEEEEA